MKEASFFLKTLNFELEKNVVEKPWNQSLQHQRNLLDTYCLILWLKILNFSQKLKECFVMTGFKKAKSHNWIEADNAFGDFDALEDTGMASKRKRVNNNTLKSASKTR